MMINEVNQLLMFIGQYILLYEVPIVILLDLLSCLSFSCFV